jgi:hypothetical protein
MAMAMTARMGRVLWRILDCSAIQSDESQSGANCVGVAGRLTANSKWAANRNVKIGLNAAFA